MKKDRSMARRKASPPPAPPDELPRLSIAMVTYQRTEEALRTIESTCENLLYPKELRSWFVSDDGSGDNHLYKVLKKLDELGEKVKWFQGERLRKEGQRESY